MTIDKSLSKPVWTEEQLDVIQSQADSRILVNAGPGTGKTAVACARIAYLINQQGVEPVNIWLVSFTRTAVHELRSRIADYLDQKQHAAGIRIATIDSHSWAIHSGFNREASLTGSFEDNIRNVIRLIQSKEGVFEYLAGVQHLFIDEAQDVVGDRCELMLEIINSLAKDAGVTVLADEAQSIFGFAEDLSGNGIKETLPEAIREYFTNFIDKELLEIHRTSDHVLCRIFKDGRKIVSHKVNGYESLIKIRQMVKDTNHGDLGNFRDDIKNIDDAAESMFLLFRTRGEALEASSYLGLSPHRIRMSGLPTIIMPWIARIFWDYTQNRMDKQEFLSRWHARITAEANNPEYSWETLVRFFGITTNQISVEKLASRLAGGSPPLEFCRPDFGLSGPVVGTIHGVKGREADEVRLYLPNRTYDPNDEGIASGEESRIIFVGATRARKEIKVGKGSSIPSRRLEVSGRTFTSRAYKGDGSASVEIGRQGDIDAPGLAGKQLFCSCDDVEWAQDEIYGLEGRITDEIVAMSCRDKDFRYSIHLEERLDRICFLTKQINNDMFRIAEQLTRKTPPFKIKHLRAFGTRTLVLKPDDPIKETLHAPWCYSGFILAPLVLGYSSAYFTGNR